MNKLTFWCLLLSLFALAQCRQPPDEKALRATIDAMQSAAEARDAGAFMEHVASDYSSAREPNNRIFLERYLRMMMLQQQSIGVTRTRTEITLYSGRATARVAFIVTGTNGSLFPERIDGVTADTGWRIEGGEWKLLSADWQ